MLKTFGINKPGINQLGITSSLLEDWSAYWTTRSSLYAKGRSGLTIPALVGDDPTILLPVWNNSDGGYSLITDNGALDIGNTYDFTFIIRCLSGYSNKTVDKYLGGKNYTGLKSGRYGFWSNVTTGYLRALIQTSGGTVFIDSPTDYTSLTDPIFLRMDVNQTTKKFRFFINEVQVGSDASFTGTFDALANTIKFVLGAGNKSDGTIHNYSRSYHSDAWIYRRLLGPSEAALLMAGGQVSGAFAHWTCGNPTSGYNFDTVGNYNLAITTSTFEKFVTWGSSYCLDKGYTFYSNVYYDYYLPLTFAGEEITPPTLKAGTKKVRKYIGMLDYHNLANSMIQFSDAFWDRSNTIIWNDYARETGTYYDSTDANTKKRFHPTELVNLNIATWLTVNYRGIPFFNIGTNSYFQREKLEEIIQLTSNSSGAEYNRYLNHFGDLPSDGIYESDDLYWKIDSSNILFARDNKVLKYDYAAGTIYLSIDGGVTYPYSNVIGQMILQYSFIHTNGNISFSSRNLMYISSDNLTTVRQAVVKDIDGSDYTASNDVYNSLFAFNYNDFVEDGIVLNGCYRTVYNGADPDINIWETSDSGENWKSIYKAGVTLVGGVTYAARHSHAIIKAPDGSVWFGFGDSNVGYHNECNIIKGERDPGTGSWTFTKLYGDAGTTYKFTNFAFYDANNIIVGDDDTGSVDYAKWGIWTIPTADLGDKSLAVVKYKVPYGGSMTAVGFYKDNVNLIGYVFRTYGKLSIVTSKTDADAFVGNKIFLNPDTVGSLVKILPKNTSGWNLMQIYENTEASSDLNRGEVLWIKLK